MPKPKNKPTPGRSQTVRQAENRAYSHNSGETAQELLARESRINRATGQAVDRRGDFKRSPQESPPNRASDGGRLRLGNEGRRMLGSSKSKKKATKKKATKKKAKK